MTRSHIVLLAIAVAGAMPCPVGNSAESEAPRINPVSIDILPAGEKRTYQITLTRDGKATDYTLHGNPKWIDIDANTGLITFNAPKGSTDKYSFSASVTVDGQTLKTNTISGVVKPVNAALQDDLRKAPARVFVDTGASVGTVRTSSTYMVPNRMNPRTPEENTWDIIQPYFKNYSRNIEVVIIDGDTGAISKITTDLENWHGNSSIITKEGKMYHVSKKSRNNQQPSINIYDPVSNKWTLGAIRTPRTFRGSEYALITVAPDGAVFVASTNIDGTKHDYTLRYLQIDSGTNTVVHDSGPIGNEKGGLWQLAADDDYVYLLVGKVPWRVLQYNRKNHTVKVLARAKARVGVTQTAFGVVMNKGGEHYFLYKGRAILAKHPKDWRSATPPWPFPEGYTARDKWHTLVIKRNIVELNLPARPKVITQNIKAINGKAELWVKQPADRDFKKHAYEVKTYPATLARLILQPDGRILAGTGGYGPYVRYNPETKKTENIDGMIGVSLGVITKYKDKIYMSGYPMGALYEYDYTQPWTQGTHSWTKGGKGTPYTDQTLNPRFCRKLSDTGSGAHTTTSTAIADGVLYFGGAWRRNGRGGGLGWYDPATRKSGGLWKPFSNYQIHYMTSILDGKYIVIGAVAVTDVQLGKPKPATGRLFLFNPRTKEIEKHYDPVPEFTHGSPGQIVNTDGPFIIGMTNRPKRRASSTFLYRLNMLTGQMDYKIEIKNATLWNGPSIGRTLIKTPKGKLLFWAGSVISKLDPVSGQVTPIAKYSDAKKKWFGYMGDSVLIGNDLYIAKFKSLLKLPDVLKPATPVSAAAAFGKAVYKSSDGKTMPYRIHLPRKMSDKKKYPLVLMLHGSGERGTDNEKQLVHGARDIAKYTQESGIEAIIIVPQCPGGKSWGTRGAKTDSPSEPMRLVIELLAQTTKNMPVDKRRVYVTGLSMGGFGTWDIIQRMPEYFAAAMPICGGGDTKQAIKLNSIPIWAFHGAKDTAVRPQNSREMIAAIKAAGGKPKYTDISQGRARWGMDESLQRQKRSCVAVFTKNRLGSV